MSTTDAMLDAVARADWPSAYRLAGIAARQAPEEPSLHYVAGIAALELGHARLAVAHLERAVRAWPRRLDVAARLTRALAETERLEDAVALAGRLLDDPASDAGVLATLGVVYTRAARHEHAARAYAGAAARDPDDAGLRFDHATSLMYLGDFDGAQAEYEACLARDPAYWRAYLALARLRTVGRDDAHVERFTQLAERHADDPEAQLHLHLAIAKELEDLGEYPRAFEHYRRGKGAIAARLGPSRPDDAALFDAIRETAMRLRDRPGGFADDRPLFVLGMPRSGTTLVDRILASHPDVRSAGELGHFAAAMNRAAVVPSNSLAGMVRGFAQVQDWTAPGAAYVAAIEPLAAGARRVVDKLPHNFLFAGLIAKALPDARIVWLRRDVVDTCLANYRQLFATESAWHRYSFDLDDIVAYVAHERRLFDEWQAYVPGRILELRYEDLVADPEANVRRLLDFCGLDWDPRCMVFHETRGAVATASAVQVRRPLHAGHVGYWRRYGSALDPLLDALRTAGFDVPASSQAMGDPA